LNGQDEAIFTVSHEAVKKLDMILNDEGSSLVPSNSIIVELISAEGDSDCHIAIYEEGIDLEVNDSSNQWGYRSDDGEIHVERDDNTISITVYHLGIGDIINNYEDYRVNFHDFTGMDSEELEKGFVTEIVRKGQALDPVIRMELINSDTVYFLHK